MRKVTLPINFNDYNFVALAKKEKQPPLKARYLALSHLQKGHTVLEAAARVYKSSRMVHRWINKLNQFGIKGLQTKEGQGRKRILTESQEKEVKLLFLKQKEKVQSMHLKLYGYHYQSLLKKHYNISCTLPTIYNMLERMNIR